MSKILTAGEFIHENYQKVGLGVKELMTAYASYIAQEYSKWILNRPFLIKAAYTRKENIWWDEVREVSYTDEQLFELFKKENGL